jgi:hypothetical protein
MAGNHVLLETVSLTQAASSVTFDNIPQTGYTDLKIVASTRGAQSGVAEANTIYFNGDTTNSNYPGKRLLASGSAASSDQTTTIKPGFFNNLSSSTANTFSNSEVYIPNYTGSTSKSFSVDTATENNATEAYMALVGGRWTGTAAITSITFTPESANNFAANSTFSLYGVAASGTTPVSGPKATGGNIVATDGTYWYHAFLSTGTFTPQTGLSCDAIVVAGGGGGGYSGNDRGAGGGGAGGYRTASAVSVTSGTNYTVAIGAGGGYGTQSGRGASGTSSTFSTITSSGGGGGGSSDTGPATGGNGGSGGGGCNTGGTGTIAGGSGNAGGYSPVEGYAGGSAIRNNDGYNGGGGGGAGGVGANASAYNSSNTAGGAGVAPGSTWASATSTGVSGYYAAGGAGAGATRTGARTNAVSGTGNGGDGNAQNYTPANGGSGIVIIRYAI